MLGCRGPSPGQREGEAHTGCSLPPCLPGGGGGGSVLPAPCLSRYRPDGCGPSLGGRNGRGVGETEGRSWRRAKGRAECGCEKQERGQREDGHSGREECGGPSSGGSPGPPPWSTSQHHPLPLSGSSPGSVMDATPVAGLRLTAKRNAKTIKVPQLIQETIKRSSWVGLT